ncbi:MAG: Fic family protein [Bacteroidota bacterium]
MKTPKQIISSKYTTEYASEYQPGSHNRVLKNKLGITRTREIEDAELEGYMYAERRMLSEFAIDQRISLEDIDRLHRLFLGSIYQWAGTYRTVNISKGGFPFASAHALPTAMKEFEKKILKPNTPCSGATRQKVTSKIAIVHAEFLLLHPYREGNGRTARLLATLMAYQANLQGIDFGFIGSRGKHFNAYVGAIHSGLKRNYAPMQNIIAEALRRAENE